MDALIHDLRHAVRGLVRTPGFALLTILCLALGIGVNSAVFSIADTVSLRPLPFREPDRLVAWWATQPSNAVDHAAVSYLNYVDWKSEAHGFSDVAAHAYRSITLTERSQSERFQGSAVSWNLFQLLGVDPVLGRHLREDDDRPGAAPVVVISHGLWQRRFLGDPAIVGRSIVVNGAAHTVIAVMPPRFQFPQVAQLWIPLAPLEFASGRGVRTVIPYARLAAGTSIDAAQSDLASVAGRSARMHPEDEGWGVHVVPMRDDLMPAQVQLSTVAMAGAVSLVLLIACANVANLLLARATARQREIAVRTALGAGRWRLIRQLLTESVLLGTLSAPLGVAIAYLGLNRLTAAVPSTVVMPYYVDWSMNRRVILYTVIVSVSTGLLFGLAPAIQAVRANLFGALKDGGRGSGGSRSRNRMRNTLVAAEVALSLVLLVGSSLFVRSFLNIQNADPGIDTERLMTMRIFMADEAYPTPESMTTRVDDIVHRLEALPGVASVFASNFVPLGSGGGSAGILPEGAALESGKEPRVSFIATTAHVAPTLGTTLVQGRDFTDAEGSTRSGVAIVTRAFAKRIWPERTDVVERRFRLAADPPDAWLTVIGVVDDFQLSRVRDKEVAEPVVILPYPYQVTRDTGFTIRVAGGFPATITGPARQAIGESDPLLALFNVLTGEEIREGRFWTSGFLSWMFSIFGMVALFLASIGIYGVLSYSVAQRTQEFGIRVALGATRGSIFSLVLAQGARLAAVGIAFGIAGAFLVTRLVQALLYNVTPTDPVSFGGTALVLVAVTILAGFVPARRATAVDPIVALRGD